VVALAIVSLAALGTGWSRRRTEELAQSLQQAAEKQQERCSISAWQKLKTPMPPKATKHRHG
jgi:hypothetical protein